MLNVKPDLMRQLAVVGKGGVNTPEPHVGPTGPGPFGGSFDWHSCVHAHWMLLSLERFGAAKDEWLHERLAADVLAAEYRFLQDHPDVELPYGRAWLLLLINELRKQGYADAALEELNDQLQAELIGYLQTHPFPELPDRAYPYLGTHYSWLFAHWLCALATQLNGDDDRAYRALYDSRVRPAFADLRRHDPVPNDFLDLRVMADLAALMWEGAEAGAYAFTEVPAEIDRANAHLAGRLFQELWARAVCDPASVADRFADLLAREHLWKFNFPNASHWVPQFAWMAVYLGAFYRKGGAE